jgi:hypothetical protein
LLVICIVLLVFNLRYYMIGNKQQPETPTTSKDEKSDREEILSDVDSMLPECPHETRFIEIEDEYKKIARWEETNEKSSANQTRVRNANRELFDEYQRLADDCVKKNCPEKARHLKYIENTKKALLLLETYDRKIEFYEDKVRRIGF